MATRVSHEGKSVSTKRAAGFFKWSLPLQQKDRYLGFGAVRVGDSGDASTMTQYYSSLDACMESDSFVDVCTLNYTWTDIGKGFAGAANFAYSAINYRLVTPIGFTFEAKQGSGAGLKVLTGGVSIYSKINLHVYELFELGGNNTSTGVKASYFFY